ncbi:MAG: mannitol dehydrogenase family protein, partial [Marmoricola sp.]|nr:mannitol dehydrogenase family protein [Marmoricola sp.]
MTELNTETLGEIDDRVPVPSYDRSAVGHGIVHLGVGGFHRAHEAMYVDALLDQGSSTDWGITGVGLLDQDRAMRDVMRAQDCLYTMVVKNLDGS